MSVILGLDQSFTSTGLFLFVNGSPKTCDLINTTKDADDPLTMYRRAKSIALDVFNFISEHGVEMAVIEGLGFGARGDQTRNLGGLQYCIMSALLDYQREEGLDIKIVPPTTLKKFSTGSGKASKDDMLQAIMSTHMDMFQLLNSIPSSKGRYDLVDAYWLGMWGLAEEAMKD